MDYIQQLRQLVGHFPLILVGAGVLILDEQQRLLLLRRTDNACWGIPGGALEPGETLEAAARRETQEETGLHLAEIKLFGVFSGPEFYYLYPNGDPVHNVSVIYLARAAAGALSLAPAEHTAAQYFPLHQLPAEISPPIQPILSRFVSSR